MGSVNDNYDAHGNQYIVNPNTNVGTYTTPVSNVPWNGTAILQPGGVKPPPASPLAAAPPPKPTYPDQMGSLAEFWGNSGKAGSDFYKPQMQNLTQQYADIASGKFNPANDAARSRFIDSNNAGFDANAEKIKSIFSGFGRSGSTAGATALANNEIGRYEALSNNDSSRMMDAQKTLTQLLGLNIAQASKEGAMGGTMTGAAGELQNNQHYIETMANTASQTNNWNNIGNTLGAGGALMDLYLKGKGLFN